MEAPLHVAASTLLRNLSPDYSVRFYFLLTGFSAKDIDRLRITLDGTRRKYSMKILETSDTSRFQGFPSLHGNYTTYYRLLLPELVHEERLLYLDSDIQVKVDVAPLFEVDMASSATGLVFSEIVSRAYDSKFLLSLGKSPDDPVFNAGVMLFNLVECSRQGCSSRVFAFCQEYRAKLINNDQTIVNAIFGGDCYHMDPRYNVMVYPTTDPETLPASGIFHFVGNPKPWDFGGHLLLRYAGPWFDDLRRTSIPLRKRISWLSTRSWRRLPKILGGHRSMLMRNFARQ